MKPNWVLVAAAVLLVPPIPFSRDLKRSLSSSRRSLRGDFLSAARVWQNWADFGRALLGAFLLSKCAFNSNPAVLEEGHTSLAINAAVVSIAVLLQTIRVLRQIEILAPIFFLSGITLCFGALDQGAFAVGVGWLFAVGGKNLVYQLPAMAIALVVADYFLGPDPLRLLNCALIFLPLVLSVLFRKRLVFAAAAPAPILA